jgi:hypothetical protein
MGTEITDLTHTPDLESQKDQGHHHVEDVNEKDDRPEIAYDEADAAVNRTGLRRMLRRNPSLEFMRDVARENENDLDPVEVKQVSGGWFSEANLSG